MKDTFFNKGEEIYFEIGMTKNAFKKLSVEQLEDLISQAKVKLKQAELDSAFEIDYLKIDVVENNAIAEWHFICNSAKTVQELEE